MSLTVWRRKTFGQIDCNSENFSENFAVLQTSQLISVPRPGETLASRPRLEKHASKVVIIVCIIQPPPSRFHFVLDRKTPFECWRSAFYQSAILAYGLWMVYKWLPPWFYISFGLLAQGPWPLDKSLFGQYWFQKILDILVLVLSKWVLCQIARVQNSLFVWALPKERLFFRRQWEVGWAWLENIPRLRYLSPASIVFVQLCNRAIVHLCKHCVCATPLFGGKFLIRATCLTTYIVWVTSLPEVCHKCQHTQNNLTVGPVWSER